MSRRNETTISADQCRDTMNYYVILEKRTKMGNKYEYLLDDKEKDLFDEYAPKLFDTYSQPENLTDAMTELIELYLEYKHNKPNPRKGVISPNQFEAMSYDESPIPNKNKSRDEQIDSFKSHLEGLCRYLGGRGKYCGTKKRNDLKDILQDAYNNPNDYLPARTKTTFSKDRIKSYLVSLKLKNKTLIIEEFIKKIK